MTKLTIKMLARELNLSVSTVSKAMRDSHEISAETKQRVNLMAKRLSYVPNAYASSLSRRSSKTIGIVIPEVVDSFFALAINGVESVAQEKGYHVLIYLSHECLAKEISILKDFESGRVDGVLMSVSRETNQAEHINKLISKGIPVILFDRIIDKVESYHVSTNDYESAYEATEQMIRCGCKNPLFLSFSNQLSITGKRCEGFKAALARNNIPQADSSILELHNDHYADYKLLKDRLSAGEHIDGILSSVEKLAILIYQVCEELQLTIPGDVQVISYSNSKSAAYLNPPLSTITQPAFEIGKTAATTLLRWLHYRNPRLDTEDIVIPSSMVLRKSTKPPVRLSSSVIDEEL